MPRQFVTPWQLNDRLAVLLLGPYPTVSLQFESILAIYKESLSLKRIESSCSDHSFSMVLVISNSLPMDTLLLKV